MTIAYYYDASKNEGTPENPAYFAGVPLRDLEQEEFDALPTWLQASVAASPMYRKSKPRAAASSSEPPSE